MKKKIALITAALAAASSIGFASPLNDFSQGKVAVDVSFRPSSDLKISDSSGSATLDGKTYGEFGLTVGLGNNFAFEYKGANPKSKDYNLGITTINAKLETQELNVVYKVDNNYSVFTGVNQVKSRFSATGIGESAGDSKTNWQVGIIGQTPLGDQFTGYAVVAAGKDSNSWKIGTSYAINKNLDLDVFYAQNKYNKVKYGDAVPLLGFGTDADYTIKGIGYGLTYKF